MIIKLNVLGVVIKAHNKTFGYIAYSY